MLSVFRLSSGATGVTALMLTWKALWAREGGGGGRDDEDGLSLREYFACSSALLLFFLAFPDDADGWPWTAVVLGTVWPPVRLLLLLDADASPALRRALVFSGKLSFLPLFGGFIQGTFPARLSLAACLYAGRSVSPDHHAWLDLPAAAAASFPPLVPAALALMYLHLILRAFVSPSQSDGLAASALHASAAFSGAEMLALAGLLYRPCRWWAVILMVFTAVLAVAYLVPSCLGENGGGEEEEEEKEEEEEEESRLLSVQTGEVP